MNDFMKALSESILVLDGAVGTELMRRGGKGCLEAMTLDNEAAVAAVHEDYLDAGADIITTDTLCADALCLEHFGLSERSYEIARRGGMTGVDFRDRSHLRMFHNDGVTLDMRMAGCISDRSRMEVLF